MATNLSLEDQILVAIRRITRAIDLRSRTLFQEFGLTAPQLAALAAIRRLQPVTAGRIAKELHLGQPTVTGVLKRLEKRNFIQRARGDLDRRSVNVTLTAEGDQVLEQAPSLLEDQFQQELAKLKEWERTQILATLQRIADMMHANRIDASAVLDGDFADATVADVLLDVAGSPGASSAAPEDFEQVASLADAESVDLSSVASQQLPGDSVPRDPVAARVASGELS